MPLYELDGLDQGEFTEGHELDCKWRVPSPGKKAPGAFRAPETGAGGPLLLRCTAVTCYTPHVPWAWGHRNETARCRGQDNLPIKRNQFRGVFAHFRVAPVGTPLMAC